MKAGTVGYWTDGNRTAVRMSLDERNDGRLCNALRQWQASNAVLKRDATVTCTDGHVEFDVLHG